jgi:hydroxymethylbilane synthase
MNHSYKKLLRIGTRSSNLAITQTQLVANAITRYYPDLEIKLLPIQTRGDKHQGPLDNAGGKGLFTAELESALLNGELDIAVHSAKDLPAMQPDGLTITAALPREDPRDALVTRKGSLNELPKNATVGTGSLRRSALLRRLRNDLNIIPVRGNVETRMNKVLGDEPELDAVILAMAGLKRLGLTKSHHQYIHPLEVQDFIPAAAQGILAVQIPTGNTELIEQLQVTNHLPSLLAMQAEQGVLRGLNADCHSCLAVHIYPESDHWSAHAMAANPDGTNMRFAHTTGTSPTPLRDELLQQLL